MPNIYDALSRAIADHWKAHDNKYPQKLVLTPAQFEALDGLRRLGRQALNDDRQVEAERFLGVPLEQSLSTPGVLVAHDGEEIAIALQ